MPARWMFLFSALALCASAFGDESDPRVILPQDGEAVILLLLDNSASLPPLDPNTQRREAIEKIYSFLQGQPYRLVLFGGRREIHVDAPQHYRNAGQWTDFYFAFRQAAEVVAEYPEGTEFKMVLITDGILDPSPSDWRDQHVVPGSDLVVMAGNRAVDFLEKLRLPLYVILIGDEVDLGLIERMVVAANGAIAASDYAQAISDFFGDDGMLLRRFIFRVEKDEGLAEIEPIVTRISTPAAPRVELTLAGSLALALAMLIGIGVRSFPGPGDREILELRTGQPVHVAADHFRRLSTGVPAWSWKGLSLVESSKDAVAMLMAREDSTELPPAGFRLEGLDPLARSLIDLPLPELREKLQLLSSEGTKDEQIYALNLDYVARDLEEARVERLVTSGPAERAKLAALDFLRAKVHLLGNAKLAKKLAGPSVLCKSYGLNAVEQELRPGGKIKLGRYELRADELRRGGRKDFRLGLVYERVPSRFLLKRLVPGVLQRALRLRRNHERIVR